jgi:hypothetical protein
MLPKASGRGWVEAGKILLDFASWHQTWFTNSPASRRNRSNPRTNGTMAKAKGKSGIQPSGA